MVVFSCSPLSSLQAPAPGLPSWVVGAAVPAVVPPIACFLAHSCPPSSSLTSIAVPCDPLKIPTYGLRSETFPFISTLAPFAGASSASVTEQIGRSRPSRAPGISVGDVRARLPTARIRVFVARAAGACSTGLCVSASLDQVPHECPSSCASGSVVCARFARRDVP